MKKISLVALAFSTSLALFAQDQPRLRTDMERRVYAGIKGGVNIASLRTADFPSGYSVSTDNKTSFNAGLLVNVPLGTGNFALQPELLYNRLGAKVNTTIATPPAPTVTSTYEQDLHYISLPLMLQLRSTSGFFVELGPQASYLIKARSQAAGSNTNEDNKSNFDNFDVAGNAGLGFTTRVGLGISARYSHGLSNILEDGGGNNSANNGPELKNRAFQFSLFYLFGANK